MLLREDIIQTIKSMNLPSQEYWITSGAALVIHGVKETTRDIDLGCTSILIDKFIKEGFKYRLVEDNSRIVEVTDKIELLENWCVDEILIIESLPVASLESIKKQKSQLGREKDLSDIKLIDDYIKNNIY